VFAEKNTPRLVFFLHQSHELKTTNLRFNWLYNVNTRRLYIISPVPEDQWRVEENTRHGAESTSESPIIHHSNIAESKFPSFE